ncbi:MAG: SPOR domain-containing protein [Betaproteobacteria bacterium]
MLGIFIGLVMGLALAATAAFVLTGGRSPYQAQVAASKELRDPAREAAKVAASDKAADKPRFDFYKILPGGEEPKIQPDKAAPVRPDRALGEKAAEKSAEAKAARSAEPTLASVKAADKPLDKVVGSEPLKGAHAADRFWLQAGSFTDQADAENMKAQLALGGWQAAVQQGILADKSVRYRVRLGPYDNSDELSRVKNQLMQRGYESAAIRY